MRWLRGILPKRHYSSDEFSLRLVSVFRECVRIQYQRGALTRELSAEYVGRRWGALDVRVPASLGSDDLTTLIGDLEIALRAMGKEYVVTQAGEPVEVPSEERERAMARLRQIGFEPEVLPDNSVKLKPLRPRQKSASDPVEITILLQAVNGRRAPVKVLVRSTGYERAIQR